MKPSSSTRRLALLGTVAAAGLLVAGIFQAVTGESARAWHEARALGASLLVLVLPGHFLLWSLGSRVESEGAIPEWFLRCLGIGFVSLAGGYGLTLLSVSFMTVLSGQLALTGLLLVLGFGRRRRYPSTMSLDWRRLAGPVLFVVTMGVLLGKIGGLENVVPSPREEPDLVAARRILTLPKVTPTALAYVRNGTSFPYALPTYAFFLASASRLSGLDPLQLFELTRPLWGVAALFALFALARRLSSSDGVAATSVAATAFLAFFVPALARLVPFSARGEIALAVLLPTALVVALAFLKRDPPARLDWLLAPLILGGLRLAAASVLPATLSFLALAAILGVAVSRRWSVAGRALWLGAWLVAAGALPSGESGDASALRAALAPGGPATMVGREALFETSDLSCLAVALLLGGALYGAAAFLRSVTSALEASLGARRRVEVWLGGLERPRSDGSILLPGPRAIARTAAFGIALSLGAALTSIGSSFGADLDAGRSRSWSLFQQLRESRSKVDVRNLLTWIETTRYLDLPAPLLEFIREQPPGKVYAYDPSRIARLAVVTPHYVFSSGELRPEEAPVLSALGHLDDVPLPPEGSPGRGAALAELYPRWLERFPLANDRDDPSRTTFWLEALSIDFALFKARAPGASTPARLRSRFSPVLERYRFTLYEVRPPS